MAFSAREDINDILRRIGFKKRTPIQEKILPLTEHRDVMGLSETGTGKTACFVIPLVEELAEDPFGVHSLILTPTRELALQTKEKVDVIGNYFDIKCELIHGGMDTHRQVARLQAKPHIVIATPGRLADMLCSEENIRVFKRIKKVILDEADLLLNGDQSLSVYTILSSLLKRTPDVQMLLFSATDIVPAVPVKIREKAKKDAPHPDLGQTARVDEQEKSADSAQRAALETQDEHPGAESPENADTQKGCQAALDDVIEKTKCPALWKIIYGRDMRKIDTRAGAVPKTIVQEYAVVHRQAKEAHLARLLQEDYKNTKVMVFMNKAEHCAVLSEVMQELGINAVGLSRYTDNKTRHASFYKFRCGLAKVLLTTDVLSRGLDISDVGCVINYDLPNSFTDYVHRIGRTGRISQSGYALSFVSAGDMAILRDIQAQTASEIKERELEPFTSARLMNKISTQKEFVMSRMRQKIM
ncbi:uncharacterized protein NEMAJ01_1192 [Nematocida major]|uniref:uncharacterized protein n=1 Tax=Nematocida major TaxID=1912982 RepID=UPI002008D242|nr:uncharacterized protein NEMAJ01_1192 [Nematocida major]KAH9386296.1 hypothetical protein NEMAJ01_1192 [Nematocida major]